MTDRTDLDALADRLDGIADVFFEFHEDDEADVCTAARIVRAVAAALPVLDVTLPAGHDMTERWAVIRSIPVGCYLTVGGRLMQRVDGPDAIVKLLGYHRDGWKAYSGAVQDVESWRDRECRIRVTHVPVDALADAVGEPG